MLNVDRAIVVLKDLVKLRPYTPYLMGAVLFLAAVSGYLMTMHPSKKPPALSETIPHVSNTYLYMSNQEMFLAKAT